MKHIKKLLAFAIVAVMMLSLCGLGANAATITVDTSSEDVPEDQAEAFVAYKIFDVTKTDDVEEPVTDDDSIGAGTQEGFAYSIAADSPWLSVVQTDLADYFQLTASADGTEYSVVLKDPPEGSEITTYNNEDGAKAIAAILKANIPTNAAKVVFDQNNPAENIPDGYYLITSSYGTNLILATSNMTITSKNQFIVDDKVEEKASVTIGESVTYYVKVFLPPAVDTSKPVIVHDVMDAELSFNNDVQVCVLESDPGSTAAAYKALGDPDDPNAPGYSDLDDAYEVITTPTDGCTFEISITVKGEDYNLAGKYLVFRYSAELTSAADPDGDGYVNQEFSSQGDYDTLPSEPEVYTYDFSLNKVDAGNTPKTLTGAKFEMYFTDPTVEPAEGEDAPAPMKFLEVELTEDEEAAGYTAKYKKADSNDTDTVTELEAGMIIVGGFGEGTYYLLETQAPSGFNKLDAPIIITYTDKYEGTNGAYSGYDMGATYKGDDIDISNGLFNVVNQSGTVLPSTGGIGTTIFYVVGGILLVGAFIVLITKKRVSQKF